MKTNGHNGDDGPSWPHPPRHIDMSGAGKPKKKGLLSSLGCGVLVLAILGIPALSIWGVVDLAVAVTS